jgi:hypothetical protein
MAAHAWLRVGRVVLLGGEARVGYVPVTSYHSGGAQVAAVSGPWSGDPVRRRPAWNARWSR